MADDDALRSRRARAHQRGDHSLCLEGRCATLTEPVTHGTRSAVETWSERLGIAEGDSRFVLLQACLRLADSIDADRNTPQAVKELVATMSEVRRITVEVAASQPSEIDMLLERARERRRRYDWAVG